MLDMYGNEWFALALVALCVLWVARRNGWIGPKQSSRAALVLPPGASGLPLLGETLLYWWDPDGFVRRRAARHGLVFRTHLFGRATVLVGGAATADLLRLEGRAARSSLPAVFRYLHTPYGALNMRGAEHANTRAHYKALLASPAALRGYATDAAAAAAEMRAKLARAAAVHADQLAGRPSGAAGDAASVGVWEAVTGFVFAFAQRSFFGVPLPRAQRAAFRDYSRSLFGIVPVPLPGTDMRRGKRALDSLVAFGTQVIRVRRAAEAATASDAAAGAAEEHHGQRGAARESGKDSDSNAAATASAASHSSLDGEVPGAMMARLAELPDHNGKPWGDERAVVVATLLTWAAHDTAAGAACAALLFLQRHPHVREALVSALSESTDPTHADCPLLTACVKEALRLEPVVGGGFRLVDEPLRVGGFDVPAGWVVSADHRIAATMPSLFPRPDEFLPQRWLEMPRGGGAAAAHGLPMVGQPRLPLGAYFPFGTGLHQCPGWPVAYMLARVCIATWVREWTWKAVPGSTPRWTKFPTGVLDARYRVHLTPLMR